MAPAVDLASGRLLRARGAAPGRLRRFAPGGSADGGQAILVGGGYINKCYGRNGWAIEVTYINGWPHTSLTAAVAAGSRPCR